MIWVSDMDMKLTFVNQVWRDFTGYRSHQALSESWQEFIHTADLQHCMDYSRDKYALRESFTVECRLRSHDGSYRWVLSTGIPRLTPGGECLGYIGTCIDISDRRQADAEKWQHLAQLSHLNRISTMGEFAASVAHELTQPLSAIHNNAEAAARMLATPAPDFGTLREIIQDVRADDRRASDIIHSMRRFLQRRELAAQPLDLDAAVAEVIRLVSIEATVRHMPLRLEAGEQAKLVTGDRVHLQQVVMNLILNAMEALAAVPESERIIVVATRLVEPGTPPSAWRIPARVSRKASWMAFSGLSLPPRRTVSAWVWPSSAPSSKHIKARYGRSTTRRTAQFFSLRCRCARWIPQVSCPLHP